jgi:hypothetical protein
MQYLMTRAAGAAAPGGFSCLQEAMTAAGHPDPADWELTAGYPGRISARRPGTPGRHAAGSAAWCCRIDAPGVAHELVDAVCDQGRDGRAWSRNDLVIISAVVAYFLCSDSFLPAMQAWQAAARIAGHFTAAGEVARTRIVAAILAGYGSSWHDCSPAAAGVIAGQLTGRLRDVGVVVYDDRPADDSLREMVEPAAAIYRLYRGRAVRRGARRSGPACEYGTLSEAMAAAGHSGFGDWQVRAGDPGRIFLARERRRGHGRRGCVIEAPGIARQYGEACPDEVRMNRRWSAASDHIMSSVEPAARAAGSGCWVLPPRSAARAAARLAAQHATGTLTATGIFTVLAEEYSRIGMVPPPDVADEVTTRIAARLALARVAVCEDRTAGSSLAGQPVISRHHASGHAGPIARCLDGIFWRLTAPPGCLVPAPARSCLRPATLRCLISCWILPLSIPAAAALAFCSLPGWPDWIALVLLGGAIQPSAHVSRARRLPFTDPAANTGGN